MITIEIVYSKHALQKVDRYGLDIGEIERTIKQGMKWKEEGTEKWHAHMAGVECVFIKNEGALFIITVYRSGGRK